MIQVQSHTLSNGARVLFRPTPDKQILSVAARCRGARATTWRSKRGARA